jgi:hypothetical protein
MYANNAVIDVVIVVKSTLNSNETHHIYTLR